jgi:hypothetical protein
MAQFVCWGQWQLLWLWQQEVFLLCALVNCSEGVAGFTCGHTSLHGGEIDYPDLVLVVAIVFAVMAMGGA